jgi:CHAT domain-containing protein/Tfp pilus assembly protein PilF
MRLGVLFWNMGQPEKSADLYGGALTLAQSLNLKFEVAECSGFLKIYAAYSRGKDLRSLGRYKESIVQFERAIELAKKMASPEHELKCLRQLSSIYFQLDLLREFFLLNDKAVSIAKTLNHRQEVGRCLNNIGLYYWKVSIYSRALSYFDKALATAREFRDEEDESACLNNIGIIYRDIGHYERALEYMKEALDIEIRQNDEWAVSLELNNIGAIFRKRGELSGDRNDFQMSLNYYLRSLDMAAKTSDRKLEIKALDNIGLAYATLGDFVTSLRYFAAARDNSVKLNNKPGLGNILVNLGNVYLHLKDYQKSKACFQNGLELSLRTDQSETLWEAYFGLGQCFEVEGQYPSALACYKKATEIIDHIRSQLSLDDFKAGFARDKLKVYESLVHLLVALKKKEATSKYDEEIFQTIEKAKARAFLESLEERSISSPDSIRPEFRSERDDISKRITLTISKLARPSLTKIQREILLKRLKREEQNYMSLLNRIKSEKATTPGLSSHCNVSIEIVQNQLLNPRTAILEFFLGGTESYACLITKSHFVLKTMSSRAGIESSLRAYLKMLSTWPESKFRGVAAAQRLYQDLLSPFDGIITFPIEHLIIIPDGRIYYLPFETLIRKAGKGQPQDRYLVELYRISYAPSVSALVFLADRSVPAERPKRLLAIGDPDYSKIRSKSGKASQTYGQALREVYLDNGFDFSPLPFSKREVMQISKYFPKEQVDLYLEDKAREEVIKKAALEDYQIIHFACHGFQDEEMPLRSALILTLDGDLEEDGFLQVREISNLKLNADLVVLSACQTGRGKLENGEGILGLPRVFFYAGARSTISTLWKINDRSTSEFMRLFYRYFASGMDKAEALRLAKISMLRSKFSHPFFWAGFVLNGDYRASASSK